MSALPTLRQLRYLVALADHLNFTRAAQACFVGQSTLSAGLKELEEALGARLVERDRQTVLITPLGEEAVARARALLAGAQDLVAAVERGRDPMTGTVRLGAIPTIAPFLLPRILPRMRDAHPGLRIALREDTTARLLQRLEQGTLDFALIALPYDTAGLRVQALGDDELWLVVPQGERAARARHVTVDAAIADRLLLLEEGHCLRQHSLAACERAPQPNAAGLEASSLLTLVEMVEAGLGLALVPEMAVKSGLLDRSTLVARPLAAPPPRRVIALAARASTARPEAFEALADCVLATLRAPLRATLPVPSAARPAAPASAAPTRRRPAGA
jgi:LysR family hydrogen peroxide-inducible transcriptional activator